MTKFDRYLLGMFFKIFVICFFSFTGLYMVVHLFTNFDELMQLGREEGSHSRLFAQFYGPRILDFFDRVVSVLLLVSAVFAFAFMQRRQELTAIEAAGVPKSRMLRPLVVISLVGIGFSVYNREFWIPNYREELSSTAQNWKQKTVADLQFQKDHKTGVLVRARKIFPDEGRLEEVAVQVPYYLSEHISKITAQTARFVPADPDHPAGLLLERVSEPVKMWTLANLVNEVGNVVIFPSSASWLKGNECFLVTDLTYTELAYGPQLNDYASLSEMIQSLQRPTQWYSRSQRIAVHSRIVRPLLDLALILVALPLVVRFSESNIALSAGTCVLIIGLFQVSVMAFHTLGNFSLIRTASLAAWLPVFVFLPLSIWTWRQVDR